MKKKLLGYMSAFLFTVAAILPYHVLAEEADSTKYGKITDISKSDSVKSGTGEDLDVVISNNETSNVTVEYGKNKGIKIQYLGSNSSGRPDNAAWLGIHVTVPTKAAAGSATFTVNGGTPEKIETDGDYYFGITVDKLKTAASKNTPITYTYVFNWADGIKQTVNVKIYPKQIALLDKEGDTNLWTPEDYAKYAKQDDMPGTGDTTSYFFVSVVVLLACAGIYNLVLANSKK